MTTAILHDRVQQRLHQLPPTSRAPRVHRLRALRDELKREEDAQLDALFSGFRTSIINARTRC